MNITTHYEPLVGFTDNGVTTDSPVWVNYAITNAQIEISKPVDNRFDYGDTQGLFIIASDTPDIDITYQVSLEKDASNWITPRDTAGNDIGTIYTACTTSMFIELDLVPAPWVRFVLDPDASGTISIWYVCRL